MRESLVGGCSGGQYIHLSVLQHLGERVGIEDDRLIFNIWDGAHGLERAVSADTFQKCKLVTETISTLTSFIVVMGHGKTYESLVSVTELAGKAILQPRPLKDMKFVGHTLKSITNFSQQYVECLASLQNPTNDDDKRDEAEGFLKKITSPEFLLTLSLIQDILALLTNFSKEYQRDGATLADYYNNSEKLKFIFKNIDLNIPFTHQTVQALPNYFEKLYDQNPLVVPATHDLRKRVAPGVTLTVSVVSPHQKSFSLPFT